MLVTSPIATATNTLVCLPSIGAVRYLQRVRREEDDLEVVFLQVCAQHSAISVSDSRHDACTLRPLV
eukprot:54971-Rhodomonas_salina.1